MSRTILFVCPHHAAKSVLAVAHCSRLVEQHGLDLEVDSGGTEPDPEVMPSVVALLKEDGIDVAGHVVESSDRRFAEGDPVLVWLALQPNDAIAAAEFGAEPPAVGFLQGDDGTLAPLERTAAGEGPRLLVDDLALDAMELRIASSDGEVVATRSG